ncbi:sensor histidine kinase, partial [Nocardia rhamnosiphila]
APQPGGPAGLGGLPQRQPGANGAPGSRRDAAPARPAGERPTETASETTAPPRPAGSLPTRQPGQQRPGGLPQRDPGTNGAPARENGASGLPQRGGPAAGGPARREPEPRPAAESASGGLPTRREPGANGLPQRDTASGLPQRDSASGLPQRDSASGLPQRDSASGLPQRDTASGLPQRDTANGLPQRDTSGELPAQRGPAATGGLPSRERSGELPAQRPGALPPRREAPGNGLPQRPAAGGGLPQRGAPADSGHTARERSNTLPQRDTAAPRRQAPPAEPGALPRREPGGYTAERFDNPPGVALPRAAEPAEGPAAAREPGRHSYKSNPAKTASFFQTRLQPAEETDSVLGGTPIFAEMMSAWLSDSDSDRSQAVASFDSPGDEGWTAARRASEAEPETRTAAGLPQRNPGVRLVPGAVSGAQERTPSRNPETIRSSLSRHQQGVRDGRAMRAMNLTGDKGDR